MALRRMPANEQRRIRGKIDGYATDPDACARHVRKLKGREGYRLRIGPWRVIFDVQKDVIRILDVGPRGRIYE